jgi:hypothetical protein
MGHSISYYSETQTHENKGEQLMTEPTQHIIEEASRLTYDELKSVSDTILDMLDDKRWDDLFASPKSIAFELKYTQEHQNEPVIEYVPGKSLEGLFQ